MTETPQGVFRDFCTRRNVKAPNKKFMKMLHSEKSLSDIAEIDLGGNYLGTKQFMAAVDLMAKCTNLVSVCVAGLCCYQADLGGMWHGTKEGEVPTGNEAWSHFLEMVRHHPSITTLDISNNDCGPLVGRILESTVKDNQNITSLTFKNVLIDADALNQISSHVKKNATTNKAAVSNSEEQPQSQPQPAAEAFAVKAAIPEPEENPFGSTEAEKPEAAEREDGFGSFDNFAAEHSAEEPLKVGFTASTNLEANPNNGNKQAKMRRASKSCAPFDPDEIKAFVPKSYPKPPEVEGMLRVMLKQNLLFTHLQQHELEVVIGALFQRDYKKNEVVMTQGEDGDNMYTISKGTVDIVVDNVKVAQRGEGVSFGELALMYNTPRSATVIAATNVTTWGIDQDTYRNIVMSVSIKKRMEYQDVLEKIPFLSGLKPYERLQLADALETQEWNEDDVLLEFDQPGEYMYIVLAGTVDVIGRENGEKVFVCQFDAGKHFGELEFLNNHRTVADVVAKTKVRTARLRSGHFELCLGPIKDVLLSNMQTEEYTYYRQKSCRVDK